MQLFFTKKRLCASKPAALKTAFITLLLLATIPIVHAQTDIFNGPSPAWLTTSNWSAGTVPTGVQTAQVTTAATTSISIAFANTGTAGTNNGSRNQVVGAIQVTSARTTAMTIGGSGTTGSTGTLTLNGATVTNSITGTTTANTIIENDGAGALTFASTVAFPMGIAVPAPSSGNTNYNIVTKGGTSIAAGNGITINSIISQVGTASNSSITFLGGGSSTAGPAALTLTPSSQNSFLGGLIIGGSTDNAGTIAVTTLNSIPASGITINSGSQLQINAALTFSCNATISGMGPLAGASTFVNTGAIRSSFAPIWNGNITLAADAGIADLGSATNTFTVNGNIVGPGALYKIGTTQAGTLALNGTGNNWSGGTHIGGGIITVAATSSLGTGPLTLAQTGTLPTTLTLNNTAQTVGGLSSVFNSTNTVLQTIALPANGTLTVNQNTNTTFGDSSATQTATITGTSTSTLEKSGTGTLRLSTGGSGNTFGNLKVTSGELRLNPISNLNMGSTVVIMNGGTLSTTAIAPTTTLTFSTLNLNASSTINLDAANAHTITFAGITGSAPVNITGWQGASGASGTSGQVFFDPSTPLTTAQLGQITFTINGNATPATQLPSGEVVPTTTTAATLTPSAINLTGISYAAGNGPSAATTFALNGVNLDNNGTVTINGATDYEVSVTSATSGFGATATLNYTGTSFSNDSVWVRLKSGLSANLYNNETLTFAENTTTASTTVSGYVYSITPSISSAPICSGFGSQTISFTYAPVSIFTGSSFSAQLSDATGSFAAPVALSGFALSNGSGSQSFTTNIPAATTTGTQYRVRLLSTTPAITSSDNGTDFTISNTTTSIGPVTAQNDTIYQNGTTLTAAESGTPASRQWMSSTTSGTGYTAITGQTAPTYAPNFSVAGTYFVVCQSTYACGQVVTSNQVAVTVANGTINSITVAPAACANTAVAASFTYTAGSFPGSFLAEVLNGAGQIVGTEQIFASDNTGSQTIPNLVIPSGTPSGTGYHILIVSVAPSPGGISLGSNLFSVTSDSTGISPAFAQTININQNSSVPLTVSDAGTITQWAYATTSGGPLTNIGGATGATYTPNFSTIGTYYVKATSTFGAPCNQTVTSTNEVVVHVVYPSCTQSVTNNIYWNFTAGTTAGVNAITTPLGTPSPISGSVVLSQGNNIGTAAFITSATPVSTGTEYPTGSGTFHASITTPAGPLVTGTGGSAYFEFTVTPATGYRISLNGVSFGSVSVASTGGPTNVALRSSQDGFAANIATVGVNSTTGSYALATMPTGIPAFGFTGPVTYRLYGYGGSGTPGTAANWNMDDLAISLIANTGTELASVTQAAPVPAGSNATMFLQGLEANDTYNVSYAIGAGSIQTVNGVAADGTGKVTLSIPVTTANNGQTFTVDSILDVTTNCMPSFVGADNIDTIQILVDTFYSNGTGNINDLATFGSNPDGTGSHPADFTSNGKIYHIANRSAGSLSADWVVSGLGSMVTVLDNQPLNITGHNVTAKMLIGGGLWVSVAAGSTLTTNDSVILQPGARIDQVAGAISGNVIIQTTIPGQRGYRLLGQPYNADQTLATLGSAFDITGIAGGNMGICTSTNPSVFTYTPGSNPAYVGLTTATSAFPAAQPGNNAPNGVLAFVRGAKGEGCTQGTYTPSDITMTTTGAVNTGNITETVPANGWNLISNPYPSQVDLTSIITSSDIDDIELVVPGQQALGTNVDGTGYIPGSNSSIIPINGAFLAHNANTTTDVTLTFTESAKTATAPVNIFKTTNVDPTLELTVYNGSKAWDSWQMILKPGTTGAARENGDIDKFSNSQFNLSSLSTDTLSLYRDARDASSIADGYVLPLAVSSALQTTYTIQATQYTLPADKTVYLHDKYTNTYVLLNNGVSYPFTVNGDAASQGNNRMELVFNDNNSNTGVGNVANRTAGIMIMPNPATSNINVSYGNVYAGAKNISIINVVGQVVKQVTTADDTITIPVDGLASGVYLIRTNVNGNSVTERFVKD